LLDFTWVRTAEVDFKRRIVAVSKVVRKVNHVREREKKKHFSSQGLTELHRRSGRKICWHVSAVTAFSLIQ